MIDYEHHEQAALFGWAAMKMIEYPELRLLFAIPNGGHRTKTTAARMKAEGVKKGVPDLCLPVARSLYHGLFIELKAEYPNGSHGRTSPEQTAWIKKLTNQGYYADVCVGWAMAAQLIVDYLECEK